MFWYIIYGSNLDCVYKEFSIFLVGKWRYGTRNSRYYRMYVRLYHSDMHL